MNFQNHTKEHQQETQKVGKKSSLLSAVLGIVYEVSVIVLICLVAYIAVFGVCRLHDESMSPSVKDGDLVAFYRLDKEYAVQDAIVIRQEGELVVRRVVAVAGDTVDFKDGRLVLNGIPQAESYAFGSTEQFTTGVTFPLTVPKDEVFLLGDAREQAKDSRLYGCVPIKDTYGTVVMVFRRRGI